MNAPDFALVERSHGVAWLNLNAPVWIRRYEAVSGIREEEFRIYKSVEKVPKGRDPWTVDNRCVGGVFHTLEAAMEAAREVESGAR